MSRLTWTFDLNDQAFQRAANRTIATSKRMGDAMEQSATRAQAAHARMAASLQTEHAALESKMRIASDAWGGSRGSGAAGGGVGGGAGALKLAGVAMTAELVAQSFKSIAVSSQKWAEGSMTASQAIFQAAKGVPILGKLVEGMVALGVATHNVAQRLMGVEAAKIGAQALRAERAHLERNIAKRREWQRVTEAALRGVRLAHASMGSNIEEMRAERDVQVAQMRKEAQDRKRGIFNIDAMRAIDSEVAAKEQALELAIIRAEADEKNANDERTRQQRIRNEGRQIEVQELASRAREAMLRRQGQGTEAEAEVINREAVRAKFEVRANATPEEKLDMSLLQKREEAVEDERNSKMFALRKRHGEQMLALDAESRVLRLRQQRLDDRAEIEELKSSYDQRIRAAESDVERRKLISQKETAVATATARQERQLRQRSAEIDSETKQMRFRNQRNELAADLEEIRASYAQRIEEAKTGMEKLALAQQAQEAADEAIRGNAKPAVFTGLADTYMRIAASSAGQRRVMPGGKMSVSDPEANGLLGEIRGLLERIADDGLVGKAG